MVKSPCKGVGALTEKLVHPFPPVWDAGCRVLVLGSFPSVLSRANAFYYGNPRNRFWQVLSRVWGEAVPEDIPGRKAWLLGHHVALWDALASCEIRGSADAAIQNAVANDLSELFRRSRIRHVFLNGRAAARYAQPQAEAGGMPFTVLPSTSPANAAWGLERLAGAWQAVRRAVQAGGSG